MLEPISECVADWKITNSENGLKTTERVFLVGNNPEKTLKWFLYGAPCGNDFFVKGHFVEKVETIEEAETAFLLSLKEFGIKIFWVKEWEIVGPIKRNLALEFLLPTNWLIESDYKKQAYDPLMPGIYKGQYLEIEFFSNYTSSSTEAKSIKLNPIQTGSNSCRSCFKIGMG